jgi:hypothetical protein
MLDPSLIGIANTANVVPTNQHQLRSSSNGANNNHQQQQQQQLFNGYYSNTARHVKQQNVASNRRTSLANHQRNAVAAAGVTSFAPGAAFKKPTLTQQQQSMRMAKAASSAAVHYQQISASKQAGKNAVAECQRKPHKSVAVNNKVNNFSIESSETEFETSASRNGYPTKQPTGAEQQPTRKFSRNEYLSLNSAVDLLLNEDNQEKATKTNRYAPHFQPNKQQTNQNINGNNNYYDDSSEYRKLILNNNSNNNNNNNNSNENPIPTKLMDYDFDCTEDTEDTVDTLDTVDTVDTLSTENSDSEKNMLTTTTAATSRLKSKRPIVGLRHNQYYSHHHASGGYYYYSSNIFKHQFKHSLSNHRRGAHKLAAAAANIQMSKKAASHYQFLKHAAKEPVSGSAAAGGGAFLPITNAKSKLHAQANMALSGGKSSGKSGLLRMKNLSIESSEASEFDTNELPVNSVASQAWVVLKV